MMSPEDSADLAEPLPLSVNDRRRLQRLESRRMVVPIMILDAMLPRQTLRFASDDPKFRDMVDYCLKHQHQRKEEVGERDEQDDDNEESDYDARLHSGLVGMIGLNPHTGRPISRGVSVPVTRETVSIDEDSNENVVITLKATGHRRMEVQGKPWLHESGSFYLADVELVDDRTELLTDEQRAQVKELSKTLPKKLREWVECVIEAGATDQAGMEAYVRDLGPMPKNPTDRAFWVAALVNPLPSLRVCLEIRPAMLSCSNDLERMVLACQALQSSIDHLSGKRRLY
jgi:hypothetical protein